MWQIPQNVQNNQDHMDMCVWISTLGKQYNMAYPHTFFIIFYYILIPFPDQQGGTGKVAPQPVAAT